jgi:hypothetical protein
MKIVGTRRTPRTPAECHARSVLLEREINLLNPFPKPRGFIFKAPTWQAWKDWRESQENPRLR